MLVTFSPIFVVDTKIIYDCDFVASLNNDYANGITFMKITSNSTYNRQKTQKSAERQQTSFPRESVETADLYKRVLNKIMTVHE